MSSSTLNMNQILLQDVDRTFKSILHFVIYEEGVGRKSAKTIVAASYIGGPESAMAVSAGVIEGRAVTINREDYWRGSETFHRIERKIGVGDLVHSMVFNSVATIAGIVNPEKKDVNSYGYIIAPDGNIRETIAEHLITRYGLPVEWKDKYYSLFHNHVKKLSIVLNPDIPFWTDIQAVRIDISEDEVFKIVEKALKRRQLVIPKSEVTGKFDPKWSMKEYMIANSETFAKKLEQMRPRHTLEDKLNPLMVKMKRTPFPAQAHMIQALVNTFKFENSLICSGDMGTGKSIISTGVAHLMSEIRKENGAQKGFAVLLSAPSITLSKWKHKEILGTLPHAKVHIIRTHIEILSLYKKFRNGYRIPKGEIHFFLVGIDKAKMGTIPYYAGVWKRINGEKGEYGWHCGDCGRLQKRKAGGTWVNLTWNDIAEGIAPTKEELNEARFSGNLNPNGLPKNFNVSWLKSKKYTKCCYRPTECEEEEEKAIGKKIVKRIVHCGTRMYRGSVRRRGETKNNPTANISHVLKRFNKFFDLYIADEVHKSKASGTGRGSAFANMVKAAKYNLNLTGTLTNGKSSSIKEILWRTNPKSLIDDGFDHTSGDVQWAQRYGKLEQVINYEAEEDGTLTDRKQKGSKLIEAPGMSPGMTATHLLNKSGFLELGDMGLPLVELKEIPIFIDMDPDHNSKYQFFHKQLFDTCARLAALGVQGAWSKFIPATIMYSDRPDLGARVVLGDHIIEASSIGGIHTKEKKMVEIVKKELAENRGIVIYNNYTRKYGMNERTKEVLSAHGIRSVILNESNAEKRSDVIAELEKKGEMVIITNMKMVEVGLDLLFWPTIINNQLTYETPVFRQANRRNWRIGQEKECRCYVLVYNGTQQMAQFMKVMAGRGHALMTEGRLDKSDLAIFARDSQSSLASDLADCFANSDIADAWSALAAKDLADVEMVAEADFKELIKVRMKALANETRRLCGLEPLSDVVEKEEVVTEITEWELPPLEDDDTEQMDLFSMPEPKSIPEPKRESASWIIDFSNVPSLFGTPKEPIAIPSPAPSLFSFAKVKAPKEPEPVFDWFREKVRVGS